MRGLGLRWLSVGRSARDRNHARRLSLRAGAAVLGVSEWIVAWQMS